MNVWTNHCALCNANKNANDCFPRRSSTFRAALCSQCGAHFLARNTISNIVHTEICTYYTVQLYSIQYVQWPVEAHGINIVSKMSPYI